MLLLLQFHCQKEINEGCGEKGFKHAQQNNVNALKCKETSGIRDSPAISIRGSPFIYSLWWEEVDWHSHSENNFI